MKPKGHDDEIIMKVLKAVYQERRTSEVGEAWQARVMRSIRSLGVSQIKTGFIESFEVFLWRLAPVAAVFIMILATCVVQFDFFSDFEMANMFIDESTDFSLLPLL